MKTSKNNLVRDLFSGKNNCERREFGLLKVSKYAYWAAGLLLLCLLIPGHAFSQLKGAYTIDSTKSASKTNYVNLRSALCDLDSGKRYDGGVVNGKGVSGPVVFTIADGIYNCPGTQSNPTIFSLYAVQGNSATNTITFKSASMDSSKVMFLNPVTVLADVNHITFAGIGFRQQLTNGSVCIALARTSDVTFTHCLFQSSKNNTAVFAYNQDSSKNITIDHSNFQGDGFGIFLEFCKNVKVLNNTIGLAPASSGLNDKGYHFMNMNWCANVSIRNNTFLKTVDSGMYMQACQHVNISGNKILAKGGIYLVSESNSDSIINNTLITHRYGIVTESCDNVSILYNNIYTDSVGAKGHGACIYLHNSVTPSNNILNNNIQSGHYRSGINCVSKNEVATLDYNNYYYADSIGYFGKAAYANLKAFSVATGFETHGLNVDPKYDFANNLKNTNTALLGKGTPVYGVLYDATGALRRSKAPTIGAYEMKYISDSIGACKGSCITIIAPMTGTKYLWSTGETTRAITYCPTKNTTLTVKVWTSALASDTLSFKDYVLANKCVWPGDANDDGKADITDILPLGIGYGDTGPKRSHISSNWNAEVCDDWTANFKNGTNHKFADCNGDGSIDSNDVALIALNFTKSHSKTTATASGSPTDPPLSVKFSIDSVPVSDTVTATINLGSSSIKANNVYGITFSVSYGAYSLTPKKITADFNKSWLGYINNNMISLVVNDSINKILYIGLTRIDHTSVSGNGEIGLLSIYIPDNVAGKREVKQTLKLDVLNYLAIDNFENNINLNPSGDSLRVYQFKSGINQAILQNDKVMIYPNPASGTLHVKTFHTPINGIRITNILGSIVGQITDNGTLEMNVQVSSLPPGVYMLDIQTKDGSYYTRFIKE